jgi:hypothetical protein
VKALETRSSDLCVLWLRHCLSLRNISIKVLTGPFNKLSLIANLKLFNFYTFCCYSGENCNLFSNVQKGPASCSFFIAAFFTGDLKGVFSRKTFVRVLLWTIDGPPTYFNFSKSTGKSYDFFKI